VPSLPQPQHAPSSEILAQITIKRNPSGDETEQKATVLFCHGDAVGHVSLCSHRTLDRHYRASGIGGIFVGSSGIVVYVAANRIDDNRAHSYGGGVDSDWTNVHFARNWIIGNTAIRGGGVAIRGHTPVTLSNNLIADNSATYHGSGVYVAHSQLPLTQAVLVNNTIVANGSEGVARWQNVVILLYNNIISGHSVGITATVPISALILGGRNILWNATDPYAAAQDLTMNPLLTADTHLCKDSPAIDARLTAPWVTPDLDGNSRPQGAA